MLVQIGFTAVTNGYVKGFENGSIYRGSLKSFCVPGLSCYSCPGALGSCPIGAVQAVIASRNFSVSYYLAGFFLAVGAILGRFVCGWLCPFGLAQDLLYKIPFGRKITAVRGDRYLRFLSMGSSWYLSYCFPCSSLTSWDRGSRGFANGSARRAR
jgi:hypothetical protein